MILMQIMQSIWTSAKSMLDTIKDNHVTTEIIAGAIALVLGSYIWERKVRDRISVKHIKSAKDRDVGGLIELYISLFPDDGINYLTGPGGAGVTMSEATAQMFDPADPDRLVKAFLQEYQTLFGFGPEALDDANVQRDYPFVFARTVFTQA